MVVAWINFLAGLVLLSGMFSVIPSLGKYLDKMGSWLAQFQTIIGIIAIVFGILNFGLQGIVAIIAGLVLAAGILPKIPALGKQLEKVGTWLGGFQTIIGVIAMVLGILGIVGML